MSVTECTKILVQKEGDFHIHIELFEPTGEPPFFLTFVWFRGELIATGEFHVGDDRYYHLKGIMADVPRLEDVT